MQRHLGMIQHDLIVGRAPDGNQVLALQIDFDRLAGCRPSGHRDEAEAGAELQRHRGIAQTDGVAVLEHVLAHFPSADEQRRGPLPGRNHIAVPAQVHLRVMRRDPRTRDHDIVVRRTADRDRVAVERELQQTSVDLGHEPRHGHRTQADPFRDRWQIFLDGAAEPERELVDLKLGIGIQHHRRTRRRQMAVDRHAVQAPQIHQPGLTAQKAELGVVQGNLGIVEYHVVIGGSSDMRHGLRQGVLVRAPPGKLHLKYRQHIHGPHSRDRGC